jgi:iron(III) transport system ATP-binding protein
LLDEPFSNLDAKLRERARSWVKELQHTLGLTTIFVTHDQDEALSMSDAIAVMDKGEVQQIGAPEEIYRSPSNRFVAEFVGSVNLIEGKVSAVNGTSVLLEIADGALVLNTVSHRPPTAATPVTVAVRPEAVEVAPPSAKLTSGTNVYRASVHAVSFLGDHYEYELELERLTLAAQSPVRVLDDTVQVYIPPEACSIVESPRSRDQGAQSAPR